jgi:hypothetical protein
MEVRNGLGGDRRGPCGDGVSFGISEKSIAKVGAAVGSSACAGRGEQGMTGLGSSTRDDIGDRDSRGDGSE